MKTNIRWIKNPSRKNNPLKHVRRRNTIHTGLNSNGRVIVKNQIKWKLKMKTKCHKISKAF